MTGPCTDANGRDAWVLETAADLTGPQDAETQRILRAWRLQHGLTGEYHISTDHFGRERQPGDLDALVLQVDATPDQIRDLAGQLSQACDAPIYVRRTELQPIRVLDMRTMQSTDDHVYIDPEIEARQLRKRQSCPPPLN